MEDLPEKLPKVVQRYPDINPGWQDAVKTSENAKSVYDGFQRNLREHGLDLTKDLKVLEVGSGNAILLDYFRNQGVNAVGVDVRPRGTSESPQVIARIEQLPFPDESFDVILSIGVFDSSVYDQYQNAMMKEILRVLKRDGHYVGFVESLRDSKNIEGLTFTPGKFNPSPFAVYKKS